MRRSPMVGSDKEKVRRDFHLEEYKSLRAEKVAQGAKYNQMKWLLLAALGAIYSWNFLNLSTIEQGNICIKVNILVVYIMLTIPFLISIAIGFEAIYTINWFNKVGSYIAYLEKYLGRGDLGWENFGFKRTGLNINNISGLNVNNKVSGFKKKNIFSTDDKFWVSVIFGCLILSYGTSIYAQYYITYNHMSI
jgi:hypothetical protein